MAKAPPSIERAWQLLTELRLAVPGEWWTAWASRFDRPAKDMQSLMLRVGDIPLVIEEVKRLELLLADLKQFVVQLRQSEDGQNKVFGGVLFVHSLLMQLIRHHICNDLQIISFLLDVGGAEAGPIPVEDVRKIRESLNEMLVFWEKVRAVTVIC